MIIDLSLEDNYKFHLNNAIKLLSRAKSEDDYLIGFLSAALVLELGLKLAVRETINGDIFMREKNGEIKLSKNYKREMTLSMSSINKLVKSKHGIFEAKILNNFSIRIDSTVLDDEIDFISEIRNNLFHYQGKFDTRIVSDILKAFVFINILLPDKLSMANILLHKEAFVGLLNAYSFQFTGILSNAEEILIHQDNYFDINIGENVTCGKCGYDALTSVNNEKSHGYICLLCLSHDYFLTCSDCGMELPEDQLAYTDYESNTFLCDGCYDHAFG
ncbi:hypothetical protein [Legionella sainthelensi]|uniref:Uncharacterized protein n=1 Tax=Legionella sainthelensi TaxID=28087 RepID=A0A2H5FI82_9GAMM|nr:hypothetical protein [Legionella sainthelensi]AUH71243.1 hypothetical protein CAB17_03570 [Legionella sainthelensi]